MYDIFVQHINHRTFNLDTLKRKIDTLWVQGTLTDGERNRLLVLAKQKALAENEVQIFDKLQELDKRVTKMEAPAESTDTPAEYVPGKWYYNGNRVTFAGEVYVCTAPEGQVCVWSPTEYPEYWEKETE